MLLTLYKWKLSILIEPAYTNPVYSSLQRTPIALVNNDIR